MLLQKAKIKIQNDLTDHQSASQSDNEHVRIDFNQLNQCFDALKCLKIVFSEWLKIVLMLIPGPLDRSSSISKSSSIFKLFKSKVRQSASLSVFNQCSNALKCQKWAIKKIDTKILMLTPGPLDRTFSRAARSNVFNFSRQKTAVLMKMKMKMSGSILNSQIGARTYLSTRGTSD